MALSLQDSDFKTQTNNAALTSKTMTAAVGDVFVVKGATADTGVSVRLGNVTNVTGATITWTKQNENISASSCYMSTWTGVVTAIAAGVGGVTGAITITIGSTTGGAISHSMQVNQWRGGQLAVTPAKMSASGGSTPSGTITATGAGNIIDWHLGDWSAVSNASPTGRTTSATPTFQNQHFVSGDYRADYWYQIASGASSQTIGETLPTGQSSWMQAIEVQAVGGTNYTGTPVDPEGITDAATRVQDLARTLSDPEGTTDAATPTQDNVRTQADAEGITDSASASLGSSRQVDDLEGITDSVAATISATRQADDPEGVSDSVTVAQALARTQADPLGITDAISAALGPTRQVDDPEGITDAISAVQVLAPTQTDPVGITDSVSAVLNGGSNYNAFGPSDPGLTFDADPLAVALDLEFRTLLTGQFDVGIRLYVPATATGDLTAGNTVGYLYDSVSHLPVGPALVTQAFGTLVLGAWNEITFTGVPLTQNGYYNAVICMPGNIYGFIPLYFPGPDVAAPSGAPGLFIASCGFRYGGLGTVPDTATATYFGIDITLNGGSGTNYTANPTEAEGITDAATAAQDNVRSQADPLGITDSASAFISTTRQVDDPEGITDAASATQALARTQADAEGITDAASSAASLPRAQADPVGITDSVLAALNGVDYVANIADPIGIADTGVQQSIDYSYTLSDPEGITDAVTSAIVSPRSQVDPIGITDSVTAVLTALSTLADPEGITDSATAVQAAARTQTDPLGITDAVSAQLSGAGAALVTDPEAITDAVTLDRGTALADPEGITDAVSASVGYPRTQSDSEGITDTATAALGTSRAQADPVGITDAVSAVLVSPTNYVVNIADMLGILDAVDAFINTRYLDLTVNVVNAEWSGTPSTQGQWTGTPNKALEWGASVRRKGSS